MESIWTKELLLPVRPSIKGDCSFDAVVIGGGMTGILIAYFLQNAGIDTAVLEANRIGSGQTGKTTAKITIQHGPIYHKLLQSFDKEQGREYAEESQKSVEAYEKLIQHEQILCDFNRCSSFLYTKEDVDFLKQEEQAAQKLGIACKFTKETELPFSVKGALEFGNQANFDPMKFLRRLSEGLQIFENSRVDWVKGQTAGVGEYRVKGKFFIFACHYPFLRVPGFYFARLRQERSYVLALENAARLSGMYFGIDKKAEAKSFRMIGDTLLLGGAGHLTGKNPSGGQYDLLRRQALEYWPAHREIAHWSAQDGMSLDGIPYMGLFSENRLSWYVAAGYGKWGMVHAMTAARLISGDIIAGGYDRSGLTNRIFSPQRNLNGTALAELIRNGARSAAGLSAFWRRAPRCSHMGCKTRWNPEEKTWDCPCHGSRFSKDGELVDAPAKKDLS